MTVTDRGTRSAYLDLLRQDLTRYGVDELVPVGWGLLHRPILKIGNLMLVRKRPFDRRKRDLGLDWPADALTMIGMKRLTSLQECVETVLTDDVPGDLVECGVWRGGASILMRAVLGAYGDETRQVWLADSFAGVPPPDAANYAADKGDKLHLAAPILAVKEKDVRANFERYGLLDDRVRFLPGWFKDTLADAPIEKIAVLRLDGDLYESTIQALDGLYSRLSPGGFCIIDDYHAIEGCRKAVTDYRTKHGITEEIVEIDGTGVLWRKQ
ncbi:MAG: macrocin O-methyltransferase [Mycolicibacterium mageritense]|uniref:Methyltransferase MtfB n=1 Tax=Mycolicibacterium mageritense TaxID=53462 RepID=A0ABN5Y7C6_MYCME|nr:MAG: macrocin O-methyltransferase [Mycolicibacterium mageritense]BBX33064.1 methyltransferase MtfB [Mycolicibacterium mageritense]GJJ22844.1 methyltransferase MtfB [Mycolicibacterium mageritense]